MRPTRQAQAVMFADVSGSSRLYKQQGNTQAKQQIDTTLLATRAIIESHHGVVIKTLGDEIMARFPEPVDACRAAIQLQRKAQQDDNLALRIGISYGETLMDEHGDVFGDVVNDAADVSHIARGRQVVITDHVKNQLPEIFQQHCDAFDQVVLKGASRSRLVFRLCWETPTQPQNATALMDVAEIHRRLERFELTLRADDQSAQFSPEQLPLHIGRDPQHAQWLAQHERVSREHCNIVHRRGKFVLIDHSTNGTYVTIEEQPSIYVRREEIPLTGSGWLHLGQKPDTPGGYALHYKVNTPQSISEET